MSGAFSTPHGHEDPRNLIARFQKLSNIEMITPSNAAIFPEYILPNVFTFSSDPDEYARVAYAQSLASLASSGQRYLDMTQAMKADGSLRLTRAHDFDGVPYQVRAL